MEMSKEEQAIREGLDYWEVRVDRGFRGEFVAYKGNDEQMADSTFSMWTRAMNVSQVGLFVNGELARPPYRRR